MRTSISSTYIGKVVESINTITNMHNEAAKSLKDTVGYFGSEHDPKLISYEIIGGEQHFYNTDILPRIIIGEEFIKYISDIGFTTNRNTIILRVCIMDEDMHTLPLWADDEDYAYIIIPFLPGIHKFIKKIVNNNINPYRWFTDRKLTNFNTWEEISKYFPNIRDESIGDYDLFYNPNIVSIFGKDAWNYYKPSEKFRTASGLINAEMFKNNTFKQMCSKLYGLSHIGFVVDISNYEE